MPLHTGCDKDRGRWCLSPPLPVPSGVRPMTTPKRPLHTDGLGGMLSLTRQVKMRVLAHIYSALGDGILLLALLMEAS